MESFRSVEIKSVDDGVWNGDGHIQDYGAMDLVSVLLELFPVLLLLRVLAQ